MTNNSHQAYTVESLIEAWWLARGILNPSRPLTIVAIGAHPDDPETGCGGTLAQLAALGHNVHILYATRGEAGRGGGSPESLAKARTGEAIQACEILHVIPHFADLIDKKIAFDGHHKAVIENHLTQLKPDVVFTQWGPDSHPDHRRIFKLTLNAWEASNQQFGLALYEVMTGVQTKRFKPNLHVDISHALDVKERAVFAHKSQTPKDFYPVHVELAKRRGRESGCSDAEAFYFIPDAQMRQNQNLAAARMSLTPAGHYVPAGM